MTEDQMGACEILFKRGYLSFFFPKKFIKKLSVPKNVRTK
jgi:hypothetical protein